MNQREVQALEGALSARYPRGEVTVIGEPDGARVSIEIDGESASFSVGDGPSVLLSHLLTGI